MGEGEGVRVDVVLPFDEVFLLRDDLTLPGVGEGDGVSDVVLDVLTLPGVGEGDGVRVDVVLPLDEVFLL